MPVGAVGERRGGDRAAVRDEIGRGDVDEGQLAYMLEFAEPARLWALIEDGEVAGADRCAQRLAGR